MLHSPTTPSSYSLSPIGYIESDYPEKFGIPRQPGLATAANATLILSPPFDDPLCVRGLETFSHLWISFIFHQSPERWTPLIRPPRLGGNRKVGVFASRSTHRPNRLGLSLVALERIDTHQGVRLHFKGGDFVSGTPVVDIKPYLPWADANANASAGFAPEPPVPLAVGFSSAAEHVLKTRSDGKELENLICQVVGQDPRPAYHSLDTQRIYGVPLRDVNVRFHAKPNNDGTFIMWISDIESLSP